MKKVGENYIKKLQNKCKNRGIKKGSNEERHYKIGNDFDSLTLNGSILFSYLFTYIKSDIYMVLCHLLLLLQLL